MKNIFVYILLASSFLAMSCQAQTKVKNPSYALMLKTLLSHTVDEVKVSEVENPKDYILLDAREIEEFETSHIEGATWVGYDDFSIERVQEIAKDKKILVYCSVGYRSEKVSEQLLEAGFEDVANLYGGIFEWVNSGNEVVEGDENQPTDKVHAFDKVWGVWVDIPYENKVFK